MDPLLMEKAMLKNMKEKTGKPLEEWVAMLNDPKLVENKERANFLKEKHSIGHFYAHLIAKKNC